MARILAIAVALVLALPACASAWSLGEDVAVSQALLPADHPCRTSPMDVRFVPNLRSTDGMRADAAAPNGRRDAQGQWVMQTSVGWGPVECWVQLDPVAWERLSGCQRRRMLIHEVAGHLAGHQHSEGGIMAEHWSGREDVPVPGCRGPSLTARVTDRVLEIAPVGYEVSCVRKGAVVRCRAVRGRLVRRYRARVVGDSFTLRRVRA